MELPQHRLSWEERGKTEREKAADVKVQSPSSFITIFYQAAYSQKQIEELAKATALALAWNSLWNWNEGFEQGFQTTRWCAILDNCWFSVWQTEEPVFFPIFRNTHEKSPRSTTQSPTSSLFQTKGHSGSNPVKPIEGVKRQLSSINLNLLCAPDIRRLKRPWNYKVQHLWLVYKEPIFTSYSGRIKWRHSPLRLSSQNTSSLFISAHNSVKANLKTHSYQFIC